MHLALDTSVPELHTRPPACTQVLLLCVCLRPTRFPWLSMFTTQTLLETESLIVECTAAPAPAYAPAHKPLPSPAPEFAPEPATAPAPALYPAFASALK